MKVSVKEVDARPTRRRWLRFSLRFLFALTTGAAIGAGLALKGARDESARMAMLRQLEQRRGIIGWETTSDTGDVRSMRVITVQVRNLRQGELGAIKALFPEAKIIEQ